MFTSFRWRIAFPYALLILLTMLALGVFLTNFVRQLYLDNLNRRLLSEAGLVGAAVEPFLQADNINAEAIDAKVREYAAPLAARITIILPDGLVVGESNEDRAQMTNHADRPEVIAALAQGTGSSTRFSHTIGDDLVYTALAYPDRDQPLAIVRLAVPLSAVEVNIGELYKLLIGFTLIVTAIAIGLAFLLAGRTIRPIVHLTETVRQTARDELQTSPRPTNGDEIGQLTQAFNLMMVRLRGQFSLLESERGKLNAVLNKINDGVLIVDAEGKIQLLNPTVERMFNLEPGAALGASIVEKLRHHQPVELWQKCSQTRLIQSAAFELKKRIYLNCIATPMEQPLEGSTLLLFQDLTQQRQLENVRKDFISNVSHELRTPLAAVKALNETLQDGALEDPPAARRFLERMETEIDAMSLMVTELLELSRIESGRVPLEITPVHPIEIVNPAYERLSLQAERARLEFIVNCPPELPMVLADAVRTQQVVINLVHNAIKFTREGGKVEVTARAKDDLVVFTVRDSGIGIAPDDLPRIFERFYKADRSRTGRGTGLGLAIARHLVEAQGGSIWAESELGKGSTFYFSLPRAK